jgi:hypothetical protein
MMRRPARLAQREEAQMTNESDGSSERQDLIEKLKSHHKELIEVVDQRSHDELDQSPEPDEWSGIQQIEHQILGEEIWSGMAVLAANEDEPDLTELWSKYRSVESSNPFPPPAELRTRDELRVALDERHQQTLALIDSIPNSAFQRKGLNTGWGDLTVLQMLRGVYRHYRMHIDQIEQRESSFAPRRVE